MQRLIPLRINGLLTVVALYISLFLDRTFWSQVLHGLPGGLDLQNFGIVASLFVALNVLLILAMVPFSASRIVKPFLAVFLVLASVCGYFMDAFGTVIDVPMIANVFQTDRREASELIGWSMLWHVGVFGVLPAIAVLRVPLEVRNFGRELLRRIGFTALALVYLVACAAANYKSISLWVRAHRDIRLYVNPTYPIYSTIRYVRGTTTSEVKVAPIAPDAVKMPSATGKPRIVVLVVGETARAQNFSILGYDRPTNPEMAAIPGAVAFSDVWSCGTATAISVPCMFSRLGRDGFSRSKAKAEENLLDVMHKTGVDVLWRDNNSDCKGVCVRVPSEDLRQAKDPLLCSGGECHDEVLLDGLDRMIASANHDHLVVLHLLGSHGPSYFRRYPPAFRRFQPECARDDVQTCSRDEIVNAYDNSILYTDHVLAKVVALLQAHADAIEPTMLYVSDHGESLGEGGVYLHGLPYAIAPDAQKRVPLILWSPDRKLECIQARRGQPASQDDVFHTVLGLFSVRTTVYDPKDDLLAGCGLTS